MSVKERIKEFIKYKNIGQAAFEKKCGLSNGYINNIRKSISDDVLQRIVLSFPDLNPIWLRMGEGEMLSHGKPENEFKPTALPSDPTNDDAIPLLETSIEAGVLKGFAESQIKNRLPHYTVPGFKGADFLATVSGDSMTDRYWPGDVVGCKVITSSGFIQWGKVHVLDTTQGGLLKRIMPSEKEGFIKAVSFNDKNYPPFDIPQSEITGMALVVGVVRLV